MSTYLYILLNDRRIGKIGGAKYPKLKGSKANLLKILNMIKDLPSLVGQCSRTRRDIRNMKFLLNTTGHPVQMFSGQACF